MAQLFIDWLVLNASGASGLLEQQSGCRRVPDGVGIKGGLGVEVAALWDTETLGFSF